MKGSEVQFKAPIFEAMVAAALGGHELGAFEAVEEPGMLKYQAVCAACGKSVYASPVTLYSILEEVCEGASRG